MAAEEAALLCCRGRALGGTGSAQAAQFEADAYGDGFLRLTQALYGETCLRQA